MTPAVILPEIFLSFACVLLAVAMLYGGRVSTRTLATLASWCATAAAVSAVLTLGTEATVLGGAYRVDALSQLAKAVIAICLAFTAPLVRAKTNDSEGHAPEYLFFIFVSAIGMSIMVSARDLVTFYVGLEMAAYPLYVTVALGRFKWNSEAGIKYLIIGAASSALFLFGSGMLMGLTGETTFARIGASLPLTDPAALAALFLTMAALLFKLSLFPYHFWAPDAYEAASPSAAAFIATASKAAAAAALVRVFATLGAPEPLTAVLGIFAFFSMAAGNTAALFQKDLKRLMAYSSIAQAGYIALGFVAGGPDGLTAVLFYAAVYALTNLAAFAVIVAVAEDGGTPNPSFKHLNGLSERSPLLALLLLVAFLSLAGIPPFAGFTGKWFLFTAAMKDGHGFLVVTAAIQSVISLYYYLNAVKCAYLHKPDKPVALALSPTARTVALALVVGIVLLGLFPQTLLQLAANAVGK